jgi:hypothetical protein
VLTILSVAAFRGLLDLIFHRFIAQYSRDDTAVFLLCGATKSCKISEGNATVARGTVLRREALELAMYTSSTTTRSRTC